MIIASSNTLIQPAQTNFTWPIDKHTQMYLFFFGQSVSAIITTFWIRGWMTHTQQQPHWNHQIFKLDQCWTSGKEHFLKKWRYHYHYWYIFLCPRSYVQFLWSVWFWLDILSYKIDGKCHCDWAGTQFCSSATWSNDDVIIARWRHSYTGYFGFIILQREKVEMRQPCWRHVWQWSVVTTQLPPGHNNI